MDALFVMARVPGSPEAKTRLAADIGTEGAQRVYRELLALTLATARSFDVRPDGRSLVLLDADPQGEAGTFSGLALRTQCDGDLGNRLRCGFDGIFADGDERVVAIGCDAPELDIATITQAFDALRTSDAVIGPAVDGGYYLIGFRREAWALASEPAFSSIPWSTKLTAATTIRRLAEAQVSIAMLPMLLDVDCGADLETWLARLA